MGGGWKKTANDCSSVLWWPMNILDMLGVFLGGLPHRVNCLRNHGRKKDRNLCSFTVRCGFGFIPFLGP